jgi:hypothetical protein
MPFTIRLFVRRNPYKIPRGAPVNIERVGTLICRKTEIAAFRSTAHTRY